MARCENRRNVEWHTPEHAEWEHAQIEVLMDIRDELRRIRQLCECPNVMRGFVAMRSLPTIDKRLKTKLPLKKGRRS